MLKNVPIQRKLMMMILLTSGVVLLLTCSAFVTYELLILRQSSRQQLATLGRVIAANSIASLELGNAERAEEILRALEAEPHIVAAALYDEEGRLFATYPSSLDPAELPGGPAEDERDFAGSHLSRFQRVEESGKRFGSLYLRSNAGAMYGRFGLYGGVVALAVAVSIFVAYVLSRVLQHQISRPVLALASVAKTVSDRRDYSVRAAPAGRDELGLLTEAFNHMLEQIQKQNQVVSESEARVRAVLDSAISAAIVIDADGRVTDWNARAEAMFGWSRAEALGIGLAEMIIPEKYREVHRRGLKRFIDTGEGPYLRKLVELEALRRGRSPFPIELYISPLIDGNVISFCGFIRDLTEQKRTEEAVRAGQQLLAAVTENSTAVIYVKDVEGRYLLINRQFEQLFHVDRNSIVGKSDHDIFPREAADAFRAVDQQVLTAGRIIQTEETAPLDDGVHTYISVKCPLFDAAGKQYAMCGISTDITEHKRSQIRLQSQLGRLDLFHRITRAIADRQDLPSIFQVVIRSLEEDLPIDFGCVLLYEAPQDVLTVASVGEKSEAQAKALDLMPGAPIPGGDSRLESRMRGELFYESDISQLRSPLLERLSAGGFRALVASPLVVEERVFGVLLAARRARAAFTSGDCEFLRHLSEHVALAAHQTRLYTALQRAYDDLRQTQESMLQEERLRALGQMASGIAHDINNAISPIALYAELLLRKEPNLTERSRQHLEVIGRSIDDVAATVARMREFYRPREPQLMLEPVSLNLLVQHVAELTRARWSDMALVKGVVIDMQTDLTPDLPDVMGVEGEIREALTNLVFNAVDAMPEGGVLTLRTRVAVEPVRTGFGAPSRVACLEVADTGVGMDEATRRRCLEPFFTTKGKRGTGLGLAMVYGMVQRHSASIEIESAPGAGTTVRLRFAVPAMSIAEAPLADASPHALEAMRILIIDDDPFLLGSLRDVLENDGHSVFCASSGQAGVDAFRAAYESGEPFALVLTDLSMPHMDGGRVAIAIKMISASTPVILLTGWGQRMIDGGEVPLSVDLVLSKPPRLQEIRDALAQWGRTSDPKPFQGV